jgi:hypothetical protein
VNSNEDSETIEIFCGDRWKFCDLRMPLRLHGVALIPITSTKIMMFGGRSEGNKFNMRFYTFDFDRNKYELHE